MGHKLTGLLFFISEENGHCLGFTLLTDGLFTVFILVSIESVGGLLHGACLYNTVTIFHVASIKFADDIRSNRLFVLVLLSFNSNNLSSGLVCVLAVIDHSGVRGSSEFLASGLVNASVEISRC